MEVQVRTRLIVAVLVALTGVIFIGQGLGILGGRSVMVGDTRWAFAGVVLIVVAGVVAWPWITNRRRA